MRRLGAGSRRSRTATWNTGRRKLSRMGGSGEVQNGMGERADARDGRGRRGAVRSRASCTKQRWRSAWRASAPWTERGEPRARRCRRERMRAWPEMAQSLLTPESVVIGWRRSRAREAEAEPRLRPGHNEEDGALGSGGWAPWMEMRMQRRETAADAGSKRGSA
jgi:hypothetical protein